MVWKLGFVLKALSAVAAMGSAGFWSAAAGVPFPPSSNLTINGSRWQLVTDALFDQSEWNRYAAIYAAVALSLHEATVVARRVHR